MIKTSVIVDLERTGPIIVNYGLQSLKIVPVSPYGRKLSNIRIFPVGGGIRKSKESNTRVPFYIRITDGIGDPTTFGVRIPSTLIEIEDSCEL
jgi:hypothetical protein